MIESKGSVLHVEDDSGFSEPVRQRLSEDGWEVWSAPTGARGLDTILAASPTLLLLDYALPDMLGSQFLDRLASRRRTPPPFIVTTGMGNEQVAVEMLKRGAADCLVKDSGFLAQLVPAVRRVAHEARLACLLAQSELQLHFLAQHSADILAVTDQQGALRCVSPSAEAIVGFAPAELNHPFFELIHPDDVDEARAWWAAITATPEAAAQVTFRVIDKSGSTVWLEALGKNYLDHPALHGVIMNIRDVTARKAAEDERLEMQRQLLHSQKLESLGILAGGVAHDFNNLLAVIIGNLDLATVMLPQEGNLGEVVDSALRAAQRAAVLTRQMLAYSGRATFAMESVDLGALVRENSHLFQVSMSRHVECHMHLEPALPTVLASPGQIQQVVMNLLTNASEAIGDGPGRIHLTVDSVQLASSDLERSLLAERPSPGRFLRLSVQDDGCGMSQAVLDHIFDPFFTTKRTGRGLGMAAVLGIVRGHGGTMFVRSVEGQGTTVEICFPWRDGGSSMPPPAAAVASSQSKELRKVILVVDDDPAVRAVAVRQLHRLGATTVEAADGKEALVVVAKTPHIDAILMDLTMPNLGGMAATARLMRRAHCPPIVLCSGYGSETLASNANAVGAAGFLEKPFRLDELRRVLDTVLSPHSIDEGAS